MPLTEPQRGTLYAITANLIWGLAALYWIETRPVDARDLLAHRVLWSVPVVALILLFLGRLRAALALLLKPRTVGIMALAAVCIASNWLIFVWAVTNEHATEASLGYFLLPLFNVLLGLTLFRERIDRAQFVGILCAVVAVLLQTWHYGGLPLVAIGLVLSFGFYGAIRKSVAVESLEGLLLETLMLLPLGLGWLVLHDWGGLGAHGSKVDIFLVGAGIFTAVPLIAYVAASRILPLTALGLVFYIGPSAQLLVAVLVFGEPFDLIQALAFTLVWVGLAIVTVDSMRRSRQLARVVPATTMAK
ncbi:EamA family transporter RarD [Halieaceae bacterium]|nr:EamA family transporter RarD [Halieaceae bacterium]